MGHALSRLLQAIYRALVAFFTLKRKHQASHDSRSLEILAKDLGEKERALHSKFENNPSDEERFLHDPEIIRTKSRWFPWEMKSKKDTYKPTKREIPPPRIFVQDWSSIPLGSPELGLEHSSSESRMASRSGDKVKKHGSLSAYEVVAYNEPWPCHDRASGCSGRILSTVLEEETHSVPSNFDLDDASVNASLNPSHDSDSEAQPTNTNNTDSHECSQSSPQLPFLNEYDSFNSDSQYSTVSPGVTSPNIPNFFSPPTASYPFNPQSAVSGFLYDPPISSAHATMLGRANSVPLPFFHTARDSPSPIKHYRQTLARKKSQTQSSSLESIKVSASFDLASELHTPAWVQEQEPDAQSSKMPYPDLFRFSMYLDHLGSSDYLVNLGSLGGYDEGMMNTDIRRLSILSAAIQTTEEDSSVTNSKRCEGTFIPGILGNLNPPLQSSPLKKDLYRSAAYSQPIGDKNKIFVLGLGDGTRNAGRRLEKAMSIPINSVVGAGRNFFGCNGSIEETEEMSLSHSSMGLMRQDDSIDGSIDGSSCLADSAIAERLRDTSWDKTSFQWDEQEFLGMLRYSP